MIIGGGNNDLSRVARDGDMGRMGVLLGLLADADGTEASSTKRSKMNVAFIYVRSSSAGNKQNMDTSLRIWPIENDNLFYGP